VLQKQLVVAVNKGIHVLTLDASSGRQKTALVFFLVDVVLKVSDNAELCFDFQPFSLADVGLLQYQLGIRADVC